VVAERSVISLDTRPAESPSEAVVQRIRLRATRRVVWLRRFWASAAYESDRGMAISHGEIDRILTDPHTLASLEAAFYEDDPSCRTLRAEIDAADAACAGDPMLRQLREVFSLSSPEMDLLQLTAAIAIEPDLARVLGYLQDGVEASQASIQVAARLFEWGSAGEFRKDGVLLRWQLVRSADADQMLTLKSGFVIDPYLADRLAGHQTFDPALGSGAQLTSSRQGDLCLYPALLDDMEEFVTSIVGSPVQVELVGPQGHGKATLASQLAGRLGCRLVVVDASELFESDVPARLRRERAIRVWRSARLLGAIPYWDRADHVDLTLISPVGFGRLSLAGLETRRKPSPGPYARRSFVLPQLTRQDRARLWSVLSEDPVPGVVQDWNLSPAEILQATNVAAAGEAVVAESCRAVLKDASAELFTPILTPFTWDDMVLAPPTRAHLGEFESQARLRWQVYEDWGFGRLCPLGRGVTALFSGPSGSGKTMAAQVIARSLAMDLYRVDLAGVVNKYIGETEKRLKQVFDACERANVVLLFDEADALFGQRTQVKDAHDRFANIEIDYLLQRMEQFDGIAILATNRKGDLDKAFVRRLRFIVDFMHPGEAERLTLWRIALPDVSPAGEPLIDLIDWQFLAANVVMSAAEIKLAALGAAFQARGQGTRIGMPHVLAASRRELAKQGIELRGGELQ